MQLHQVWRDEYRRDRYLADVDHVMVVRRFRELIENLTNLSDRDKTDLSSPAGPDEDLWKAFIQTHEEMILRGEGPPPDFMKGASVPKPGGRGSRAIAAAAEYIGRHPNASAKYGKREHIHDMLEKGRFRICAASTYDDPSLDPARADDELAIALYAQPRDVTIKTMDGHRIEPLRPVEFSFKVQSDYYVWCCSRQYVHRLFDDFCADSCLLVADIDRLSALLVEAMQAQRPGWQAASSNVVYIDPFRPPRGGRPFVHMAKHFRYYYQREFRVVWLPPIPTEANTLSPVFLEIGNLSEFCDVIDL